MVLPTGGRKPGIPGQSRNELTDRILGLGGTLEPIQEAIARTDPGALVPVGGYASRKSGLTILSPRAADQVNIADFDTEVDINGYWDTAVAKAQAAGYNILVPAGVRVKVSKWQPMVSHRRWYGEGAESVIYNDKSDAQSQRHACFLTGLHHPSILGTQIPYELQPLGAGAYSVNFVSASDADDFSVDELVIVGSATMNASVPRHAQLTKISAKSSGTLTLVDAIEEPISDARIWKITGTDASSGYDVYAVEDVMLENLGFEGRSAIASKGAVYNGIFRNLHMRDVHLFFATNMLTHVLVENLSGQYSGRYLEFAMNSFDVTARNWSGQFRPPEGLQAGETMVMPIHLGEQPYRVTVDNVFCHIDERFTPNDNFAQVKGSHLTFRDCDWRFAGSAGSTMVLVPDSSYTGFPYRNIVFENAKLAAPDKARIALVGGATVSDQNPVGVEFRSGHLRESVWSEAIWFQAGRQTRCGMKNYTGKDIKISITAEHPDLSGYEMVLP